MYLIKPWNCRDCFHVNCLKATICFWLQPLSESNTQQPVLEKNLNFNKCSAKSITALNFSHVLFLPRDASANIDGLRLTHWFVSTACLWFSFYLELHFPVFHRLAPLCLNMNLHWDYEVKCGCFQINKARNKGPEFSSKWQSSADIKPMSSLKRRVIKASSWFPVLNKNRSTDWSKWFYSFTET